MKKRHLLLVTLVVLLLPLQALADLQWSLFTDTSVTNVMLMSDDNQVLSTVIDTQVQDNGIEWTLHIVTGVADSGYFYLQNAEGDWERGSHISGLSLLPSGSADTQPQTSTKPWDEVVYTRYSLSIRPLGESERVQSRCGPARTYHGAGAYKTYKMLSTDALFIENGYVLIDLDYKTVGKRIIYFPVSAFQSVRNVPTVSLSSVSAYTTVGVTPLFGPGYDYDSFDEAVIGASTPLDVFFEEDGWVFAEFSCDLGVVRAWIPVENVGY